MIRLRTLVLAFIPALALTSLARAQRPAPCPAQDRAHCEEVARIAAHPAVERAFAFMEATDDEALRDLIDLTEIPAPPFGEEVRGRAYAEMLREAGADSVWTDEVGNVIALRRGTTGGRVVAISGHLDTVFPEETDVTVRMRGDTLFAPGIGDDSRGLVVTLYTLKAMVEMDLRTEADLLFIGTVGEEGLGDLRGVKHLFREGGPRIDAFISVDGGEDDRIVSQALGSRRYRVTFKGPGGHSWSAFGASQPAHALGRAITLFDERADAYTRTDSHTSYSVGRIGGGTSVNSIPFEAWMEVDMRSENQAGLLRIDSIFQEAMHDALAAQNAVTRHGPPLELVIEQVGDRPSGATAADASLLRNAIAATRYLGDEPKLERASTDSNVPISLGIPAVTITRGGIGGRVHSLDEFWINRDAPLANKRALLILLAEGGFPAARAAAR